MLETLATGLRPPRASWPARAASAALHFGIIALTVAATRQARPGSGPPPFIPVEVPWSTPEPAPGGPGAPTTPTTGIVALPTPDLQLPSELPPIGEIPPGMPHVPLPGVEPGLPGSVFGDTTSFGGVSGSLPYDERVVDEAPRLLTHPPLRYPELLRQAGIEGRVLVEVVLDTLGRAERGSLRMVQSAHELFAREAGAVVLASRYRPARVGSRAVRVRIQVPVVFALRQR